LSVVEPAISAVFGVALLAACAGPGGKPAGAAITAPLQKPPPLAALTNPHETLIANVLQDAAGRSGLPADQLEVLSFESVTWSDGSLGCPQPGMSYTQALVPGYRLRVRAGVAVLDYHATVRGHFILCPAGQSVDPVPDERI
jgi:hypothetical protein